MTMFSGLTVGAANHLFMPQVPLGDGNTYVTVTRLIGPGMETQPGRLFEGLSASGRERGNFFSLNLIRYHASRICAAAARPALGMTLRTVDGKQIEHANICANPSELRYSILPGIPNCGSGCDNFRHFARSDRFRR
jgi:hypothetical protein